MVTPVLKISSVRFFVNLPLDGLNVDAIKPSANVWYVSSSKVAVPFPPKKAVSNMMSPVNALYTPATTIKTPPPKTDVGISDACKGLIFFFRTFATRRLTSNTAIRLKLLHTLKSQKFSICVPSCHVFIAEIDIYIFQRVESFATLQLIHMLVMVNIQLVAP